MIKVERVQVTGFANALYGMRLPKNSNDVSDSFCTAFNKETGKVVWTHINDLTSNDIPLETLIGANDFRLANNLVVAGTTHGKWLRQIQVSMKITAPMTFFWDMDTYKVSTVKNSSSRMHKITSRELEPSDFSWDNEDGTIELTPFREVQLKHLNDYIREFNEVENKERKEELFRLIIQDLPDSFNFTVIWTGSAQTCRNFYFDRRNHKQKEMRDLAQILSGLPEVAPFITTTETIQKISTIVPKINPNTISATTLEFKGDEYILSTLEGQLYLEEQL